MHYHMEKEKPHDINRSSMGFSPWHQGWELCQGEVGDQAESVHAEAQRRTPLPPSHHLRGCPSRLSIPVDVYQSAGGCPNNRTGCWCYTRARHHWFRFRHRQCQDAAVALACHAIGTYKNQEVAMQSMSNDSQFHFSYRWYEPEAYHVRSVVA